jgi:hypothetical protein
VLGYFGSPPDWLDVHGAGSMRADYKSGDAASDCAPSTGDCGVIGPQQDQVRVKNYVRCVRGGLK